MRYAHGVATSPSFTEALDGVLELTVLLHEDMSTSLATEGLTTSRAHLLWVLHHGGPTTQRALADAIGVSARTITGLVDGLEATGFVTREPHPTDRRATLVQLTGHGATSVSAMAAGHTELADQLFADLPPEVFDGFVVGLDAVLAHLRAQLPAGG